MNCNEDNCVNTVVVSVTIQLAFVTLVGNLLHLHLPLKCSHIEA